MPKDSAHSRNAVQLASSGWSFSYNEAQCDVNEKLLPLHIIQKQMWKFSFPIHFNNMEKLLTAATKVYNVHVLVFLVLSDYTATLHIFQGIRPSSVTLIPISGSWRSAGTHPSCVRVKGRRPAVSRQVSLNVIIFWDLWRFNLV